MFRTFRGMRMFITSGQRGLEFGGLELVIFGAQCFIVHDDEQPFRAAAI